MDGAITKALLGGEDTGRNPIDCGKQVTKGKRRKKAPEKPVSEPDGG